MKLSGQEYVDMQATAVKEAEAPRSQGTLG
jgi:hypothetical protein